ncbi:hypothetical protein SO802_017257 [Lithocarpus litseifolius]|uniref:RNase H type-1 domain-containing protein n=1 Tax=Lithocarpus litseifolius TaxID=425828 RepID=A0AAW2CZH1_9ROSI
MGWKEKLLFQAGREVLIKAVIQALPSFAMSCFKLPSSLCHEIEILIRKFWWGQRSNRRKVHWVKWHSLCRAKQDGGMGFRELQKFNDALLAKQVWHLATNQTSLFHRFFKSKFFPHGSIFDAKCNRGSFAWKSILKGRDTIRRGLKWGVGDGRAIKVFKDQWIPGGSPGIVLSPPLEHDPEMMVADLIDRESHCWNAARVDAIFLPFEANAIKAIPLSLRDTPDWLYWPKNRNGAYSVKSGYKLLRKVDECDAPGVSDQTVNQESWKKIWSLHVPNRIRTLLWRACCDSLPTRVNLVRRKILQADTCPNCTREPETIAHALWSCSKLDQVWLPQFARLKAATSPLSTFSKIVFLALQDPCSVEVFANTISLIWMNRNRAAFGGEGMILGKIPAQAHALVHEFHLLRPVHAKIPRTAHAVRWKPPPPGTVKINFDGAIFSTRSTAGLGIIARDQAGLVLAALSQEIPLPTSVETVEVIAARRAILFAKELGFARVMVEGDSEVVIKAIREKSLLSSALGHILNDIHALSCSFSSISFHHTMRLGNSVAHCLARKSFCNPLLVWMEEVPPDIMDVYNHDLGFIHE